jgi:spermidine/putrescine-binding protein
MKNLFVVIALLALALFAGCSSETPQQQPEKPKTEALTGRSAFQKLYVAARGWARDAQPYRLESQVTADAKGTDGKSAVWRAGFASAAQRSVKPYTWSGSIAPDAPSRGVSPGSEDTYSPSNSNTQIFDIAFLKVDSDKALEVSKAHGGDKVLEKSPDTGVFYVLDWSHGTNELIWHVIYGDSRDNPKLRVAVNASSGDFMHVEK